MFEEFGWNLEDIGGIWNWRYLEEFVGNWRYLGKLFYSFYSSPAQTCRFPSSRTFILPSKGKSLSCIIWPRTRITNSSPLRPRRRLIKPPGYWNWKLHHNAVYPTLCNFSMFCFVKVTRVWRISKLITENNTTRVSIMKFVDVINELDYGLRFCFREKA